MTLRVSPACVVVTVVAAAWGFVVYGAGRTMAETVGFSLRASAYGAFILAVLSLPIVVSFGVAAWLLVPGGLSRSIYAAIAAGSLLGSAVSEAAILADEAQFESEVASNPSADRWRARAWPNEGCALGYVAGRGIHSTD